MIISLETVKLTFTKLLFRLQIESFCTGTEGTKLLINNLLLHFNATRTECFNKIITEIVN